MKFWKILISIIAFIAFAAIIMLFSSEWLFPEWNGSYSLGNGIYMMEWDGPGRIIVQGSNIHGRTCYGGSLIIPTNEDECDSTGHFTEWVVDATFDDKYIVAYSYNNILKGYKYYILNKSFALDLPSERIVDEYREVFLSEDSFMQACDLKGIEINLNIKDITEYKKWLSMEFPRNAR